MKNTRAIPTFFKNGLAAIGFLLFSLPLAAQASLPGWPIPHFDNARTNFNPNEVLISPANVGSLSEQWSFSPCGRYGDDGQAPAVANGVAYVSANAIDAFDAHTGAALASFGSGVYSAAVVANGMVYFTAEDGLHAYGISH